MGTFIVDKTCCHCYASLPIVPSMKMNACLPVSSLFSLQPLRIWQYPQLLQLNCVHTSRFTLGLLRGSIWPVRNTFFPLINRLCWSIPMLAALSLLAASSAVRGFILQLAFSREESRVSLMLQRAPL